MARLQFLAVFTVLVASAVTASPAQLKDHAKGLQLDALIEICCKEPLQPSCEMLDPELCVHGVRECTPDGGPCDVFSGENNCCSGLCLHTPESPDTCVN